MKKSYLFLTTLLVVATISVAVVSCEKEKQVSSSDNTEQATLSADNMDEYLISFKKKLLSAQKGEEYISLEQAQRDLGNLLNFDFGDANYPTDVYQYDTINLKLAVSDDQVDLSQLANTYNEAVVSILNIYQGIDLPEKSVYAISCQFLENEIRNDDTENVEIVLITRGLNNTYMPHDTLGWRPKNRAGTCDGQFINQKGGPEVIVSWLVNTYEPTACLNGGRLYYTDQGSWETYGYLHYDTTNNCFMIYTSFDPDQNGGCISHEEMEYYYSNILYLFHQQVPISHRFTFVSVQHVNLIHCYVPIYEELRDLYCWHVKLGHGKPNCTETNPIY